MDTVVMARALFGTSMAFHIIFATLGVGVPVMILFAEILYHIKKDNDYSLMAKRWTRGFAILLGVGIPSGTIVGVMLSLLFPGFMEVVGQVIALPFQIEIWAFFLEALFMSIYVYAADRLSPFMRMVSVFFVAVGAAGSAILITDAQAWMNTPTGFRIENGKIVDVDPWAAVFNPSVWTSAPHVALTAFMTGGFAIAATAAWKLLRGRLSDREAAYHTKGLVLGLVLGLIMSAFTAVNGHATAQGIYVNNPEKLAAAEGLFETRSHAPLAIGGWPDPVTGTLEGAIELPSMLSFLATNRFSGVVRGLNEFPREDWPPMYTHILFDGMVGIGFFLLALSLYAVWHFWRRRAFPRWLLWPLAASGPLALLGIEMGWIFSCSGRQPWTIYHVQRTSEAATRTADVGSLFILFVLLYLFLLIVTCMVMSFYFKRNPVAREWAPAKEG